MSRLFKIDMDDVLYPFIEDILPLYNYEYHDNIKFADIKRWEIHDFLKNKPSINYNIFKEFATPAFIMSRKVNPQAIRTINKLMANPNNRVYFVTATNSKLVDARNKLLKENFIYYKRNNLVPCIDKDIIQSFLAIDDGYHNLSDSDEHKILVTNPWNECCKLTNDMTRCSDWIGIDHVINKLIENY